ncbi:hypothetical protein D5125_12950 [Magnetovirga frankeli]|uniref:hypothetical protein n=1 Tax=Magnetovirga frankeli TaxID=947516 RepID=UPI0012937628|nr:hypothetical protein D5125_12950 [gamma proteobacterium SS-5]
MKVNRTDAASAYLKDQYGIQRTPRTLAKLRSVGGGPRFIRVSKTEVVYSTDDLDNWATQLLGPSFANTAEEHKAAA